MARMLLVVARTEPAQYTYLTHVFGKEIVDVILDRRVEERRQRPERVAVEKRRHDRRQRDIAKDLQTYGWGLVRRSTPGPIPGRWSLPAPGATSTMACSQSRIRSRLWARSSGSR